MSHALNVLKIVKIAVMLIIALNAVQDFHYTNQDYKTNVSNLTRDNVKMDINYLLKYACHVLIIALLVLMDILDI